MKTAEQALSERLIEVEARKDAGIATPDDVRLRQDMAECWARVGIEIRKKRDKR